MRQAFALALNRHDLVEHALQGNQKAAFGLIPPIILPGKPFFEDANICLARQLLQEALREQKLSDKDLPPIFIQYAANERSHKIAQIIQQQLKNNLNIQVHLQNYEAKIYYDLLKACRYQLGIGSWFADIRDPISFLEALSSKAMAPIIHNGKILHTLLYSTSFTCHPNF